MIYTSPGTARARAADLHMNTSEGAAVDVTCVEVLHHVLGRLVGAPGHGAIPKASGLPKCLSIFP